MAASSVKEIIPNPDPSAVTNAAIDRAVANAVAIINAQISAVNVRMDGMEEAVKVFQSDLTRVPTQLDRAINSLRDVLDTRICSMEKDLHKIYITFEQRDTQRKESTQTVMTLVDAKLEELGSVTNERFTGVAAQFSERDTRTDQRAGDTKLAVDAAFAAAKEATAKIEAGFTKQIDSMIDLITTKTENLAGSIGDLKDRLTVIESRTQGIGAAKAEGRENFNDSRALIFSVVSTVIALAVAIASIMQHVTR